MSKLFVVLFCMSFALAGSVFAQAGAPAAAPAADAPAVAAPATTTAPTEFSRTGTILVVKDASGKSTIKLIQLGYDLVVDDANKAIGDLDGKRVRVKGSFVDKSGNYLNKTILVKSFEPIEVPKVEPAAAPATPAAAPAAPAAK